MRQLVRLDDVEIWCEAFGRAGDPAVLLVMGVGASGVSWPDELCQALAAPGRYVIRYDHRDTGLSSRVDFGSRPYTLADMARDAVGVLDALDVPAAHVVGASMGGMVAQEIAIGYPERVLTLTSMISTPTVNQQANPTEFVADLPPMDLSRLAPVFAAAPDGGDPVAAALRLARAATGSRGFLNEDAFRRQTERALAHGPGGDGSQNHSQAISSSRDRRELLKGVSAPTLVVHGTEDPFFPYPHGVATAEAVPGARLVTIDGMGHELPPTPDLVALIESQLGARA
ncbi:alpha/beta fold hydrolase [Nonomuraea sp. NPDC000554]|uniref:alpha/beta fold hydrolase n=1 Tax=Nonomuraea sp. NPDC000554 TaxID=3154259 RepID=UPI00332E311D